MGKILLIEDNPDIRENTAEILQLANYDVVTAENGKIGVEKAKQELPDLIVCDIMMPVLDGFGVLYLLSKNPSTAVIPFIFLTAKTDRVDMRKGMEMGADDFITKPFEESELLNAIQSRLKKNEIIRQEFSKTTGSLQALLQEAKESLEITILSEQYDNGLYNKKQLIYREAERPKYIFLIEEGIVKTFKANDDGKELITGLYRKGDFFGYIPLMMNTSYTESAAAMEEVSLIKMPKDDFLQLLYTDSVISKKFIHMLAGKVMEREQQLIQLAYDSLRKRVAETLLKLHHRLRKDEHDINGFHISREEMAQIVGTATESLIRTLSDFRNEKLIDVQGGKIRVLNEKKLSQILS